MYSSITSDSDDDFIPSVIIEKDKAFYTPLDFFKEAIILDLKKATENSVNNLVKMGLKKGINDQIEKLKELNNDSEPLDILKLELEKNKKILREIVLEAASKNAFNVCNQVLKLHADKLIKDEKFAIHLNTFAKNIHGSLAGIAIDKRKQALEFKQLVYSWVRAGAYQIYSQKNSTTLWQQASKVESPSSVKLDLKPTK